MDQVAQGGPPVTSRAWVPRVGVCEDHPQIRTVLCRALLQAGYELVVAHSGSEAISLFAPPTQLQAIIMDVGLPDSDGRDVVQALKAGRQDAPVLFLTAYGAMHDRLQGFAAGGDDYLVKPFDIREVLARIAVLVNRSVPADRSNGGLEMDPLSHAVRTASGTALLTPTEFRMLAAILARPDQIVRRAAVVAAGWPDGAIVSENTIDSFMRRIRSKLQSVHSPVSVQTVRGIGFQIAEVTS